MTLPPADSSPLSAAIARARAAREAGDGLAALAAQQRAVDLARAAGDERERLVTLSVQLYNLAGDYIELDRYPEAVQAFEEVVALDARTGHPDLLADQRMLDSARQLAALTPAERARRAAADQAAEAARVVTAEPLAWAMSEVEQALERGDLASAVPAQQQVVRLAREGGDSPAALERLRAQLILLGSLALQAEWIDEALAAYEEGVALAERLAHADLATDRRRLERLRQLAAMPEAQLQAELASMAAARQRAQIEQVAGQARAAALAVRQGQARAEQVLPQLVQAADQMEAGEPPASPWREAAAFVRALAALLEGRPVPAVPEAYARQLAEVQEK